MQKTIRFIDKKDLQKLILLNFSSQKGQRGRAGSMTGNILSQNMKMKINPEIKDKQLAQSLIVQTNGTKKWYYDIWALRSDGPASIHPDGRKEWRCKIKSIYELG